MNKSLHALPALGACCLKRPAGSQKMILFCTTGPEQMEHRNGLQLLGLKIQRAANWADQLRGLVDVLIGPVRRSTTLKRPSGERLIHLSVGPNDTFT